MVPAPVLLFTYKRLDVLRQTIDALKNNYLASASDLFIFSDGAKYVEDESIVSEIRLYLRQISGFKSISITESKTNKGLANSIISGVSEIIDQYGSAIVLEDDLITSANFLLFMNAGLEAYRDKENVFSISGYSFNLVHDPKFSDDAYFLNRGWSWGWATWKDRWQKVDWDMKDYAAFRQNPISRYAFSKGGSDLNGMLKKQMTGKLDSWGIRWVYHQFKIKGLTLYPLSSKVLNIGFDSSATHTTEPNNRYLPKMDTELKEIFLLPVKTQTNKYFQTAFQRRMGILSRIGSKMANIYKKVGIKIALKKFGF